MSTVKLIADSGATKTEWCLFKDNKTKTIFTQGISPYFFNTQQITEILQNELLPFLKGVRINEVFYYGTGCINPNNNRIVKQSIKNVFKEASSIEVTHDVMAAARALFGREKGVACILGTGSSSCFYNGSKITVNRPGLGYVLGDEGSGAYLGKKVLQYFLYDTYDEELSARFIAKYQLDAAEILEHIYKKPLANRYLASFTSFLSENRGHYMIENILEDGINDFFFHHICKFKQSWTHSISFVGGVAYHFKDIVKDLCRQYEFTPGRILKNPMEGLIEFHH